MRTYKLEENPGQEYFHVASATGFVLTNNLLNQKDLGILATAAGMPEKIPSEKQCIYLMNLLNGSNLRG